MVVSHFQFTQENGPPGKRKLPPVAVIRVNGKPAVLLLDTGSTVSLCDWKLCGKAPKPTSLELGPWHTDSDAIRPGDLSSISLQAGIKVDGVLGLLTMVRFRRVTFDFQRHNLELEP